MSSIIFLEYIAAAPDTPKTSAESIHRWTGSPAPRSKALQILFITNPVLSIVSEED
ncbi:hypothetical protein D3C76_1803600 [compost metagenome]